MAALEKGYLYCFFLWSVFFFWLYITVSFYSTTLWISYIYIHISSPYWFLCYDFQNNKNPGWGANWIQWLHYWEFGNSRFPVIKSCDYRLLGIQPNQEKLSETPVLQHSSVLKQPQSHFLLMGCSPESSETSAMVLSCQCVKCMVEGS